MGSQGVNPLGDLAGNVAVVTGSAMGIGLGCAQALAGEGAAVALVDRDAKAVENAAASLRDKGVDAAAFTADVSRNSEVADVAAEIMERFGGVDIIVNSAGIQRYGDVVETPEELWDEVLAVNAKSMYLVCHHLVPSLQERGGGAIVNVGSVQSLAALPGSVAYIASKHAVLGLTRAMAVDHAPTIRVNCVAPGSVDTPMLRAAAELFAQAGEDLMPAWGQLHPMGRVASVEEVAQVVLFLASPRSSFVTGSCYLVDGGMMAVIK